MSNKKLDHILSEYEKLNLHAGLRKLRHESKRAVPTPRHECTMEFIAARFSAGSPRVDRGCIRLGWEDILLSPHRTARCKRETCCSWHHAPDAPAAAAIDAGPSEAGARKATVQASEQPRVTIHPVLRNRWLQLGAPYYIQLSPIIHLMRGPRMTADWNVFPCPNLRLHKLATAIS